MSKSRFCISITKVFVLAESQCDNESQEHFLSFEFLPIVSAFTEKKEKHEKNVDQIPYCMKIERKLFSTRAAHKL